MTMTMQEQTEKAKRLEESGNIDDAFELYMDSLQHWPNHFPLIMGAGRTACKKGDTKTGISFFRRAIKASPDNPEPYLAIGNQQLKTSLVDAAETFAAGLARFPDNTRLRNRDAWASIQLDAEDFTKAFDFEGELERKALSEDVFAAILVKREGRLSNADMAACQGRIAEVFQTNSARMRFATSLIAAEQYEKALEILEALPEGSFPDLARQKAISRCAMGDFKASKAELERYIGTDVSRHNILVACTKFMDASPDLGLAASLLEDINRTMSDPRLDHLLEFCRSIRPPQRALLRGDIKDHDFRLSESGKGQDTVVLVFAGFAFKTGDMPFSLVDRFFAGHGIATGSLIDRQACAYLKGVAPLGTTLDATVSRLKEELRSRGLAKAYTIGNSGGGSGAMIYGSKLGARRVLAFSPPTDLSTSFMARHGDNRAQGIIHALNKRLDGGQLNIRRHLEGLDRRSPIHAYYCAQSEGDRFQAENIAHLPEVSVHPIPQTDQHESIAGALGAGYLLSEFNKIVEEAGGV